MKHSSKTDWERLKKMSDKDIDYSDIPETDFKFWEDADIFAPHKKIEIKLEIDEDIAIWIKQFGDKSNYTINKLLRSYFEGIQELQTNV
ncbi:MAG: 3-oxoacyl-ACP synthase [Bacteroidetes bacterium]|nr:MAG: 3-oxoacyl-ACP synthase [Bacteroidota bacterium]